MKKGAIKTFLAKIVKSEGTPSSIARGVAIGLATGWIIPVGLQTPPTLFLAFVLKANKVLAWTCTCFTNPATMFFIYPIQCYAGSLLLFNPLKPDRLAEKFKGLLENDGFMDLIRKFLALGTDIIVPFFVGGIFFAAVTVPIGYFATYKQVEHYQLKRQERKLRKEAKKRLQAEK